MMKYPLPKERNLMLKRGEKGITSVPNSNPQDLQKVFGQYPPFYNASICSTCDEST